jgi:hypothetical protein
MKIWRSEEYANYLSSFPEKLGSFIEINIYTRKILSHMCKVVMIRIFLSVILGKNENC